MHYEMSSLFLQVLVLLCPYFVLAAHLILPEHRQEHKTKGGVRQDRLNRREQELDLQVRAQRSECRNQ